MIKIGLLSDTHGFLDNKIFKHFKDCDEIWHAGDIGSFETLEEMKAFRPLKAVYGNIDGQDIRNMVPQSIRFMCEDVDVFMKHIGGYPGHYDKSVLETIRQNPPKLFISGHSHILKVMYDKKLGLLHINPGSAGISGFHQVRTIIRFVIEKDAIRDLEVIEMGKRN